MNKEKEAVMSMENWLLGKTEERKMKGGRAI